QGISATTNYHDSDLLYVFSTSVAEFTPEEGYSKFRAYALLNHGGDFTAAARALKAEGYGGYDPGPLVAAGGVSQDAGTEGWVGGHIPGPPASTSDAGPEPEPEYHFVHAFPEGHFVRRYVEWASELIDAPWEYHEASALLLLAAATPSVKAPLTAHRQGLGTNLYMLIVGDSTSSRKSTAVGLGITLLDECVPGAAIADRASPEGLIQELALRNGKAAVWFPDEFSDHLERIKRRDPDMIEILLSLYGGKGYTKRRANKRIKGQVEVIQDIDRVVTPRLSILAASTPSIFSTLSNQDVERGLLPRFGIVMPRGKPERMSIRRLTEHEDKKREELRGYLAQLTYWSERHGEENGIEGWFSDDALAVLDAYEVEVEAQQETIIKRLPVMAYKIAMLSAAGEEVPHVPKLIVERRDAEHGVAVARIWRRSALDFLDNIGGRNERELRMQQVMTKALRYLRTHGGRASRTEIAKHVNILSRDLTDVQDTLCDQGAIWLEHAATTTKGGRPPTFWRLPQHEVDRMSTNISQTEEAAG
ncbi:MAG: YfjI family protein, partial [Gemmatimonadaceae bacterium]|nr:YfjI family protein [Gemmatimonadaceae bacterium]